jgi:hypothetical protein
VPQHYSSSDSPKSTVADTRSLRRPGGFVLVGCSSPIYIGLKFQDEALIACGRFLERSSTGDICP